MIFFGRYFETYERIYDPKENLKLYKDPTTKKEYYYYEIEDKTQGTIVAYLETGKFAGYDFLIRSAERRPDESEVYFDEENLYYYYKTEYTPTESDSELKSKTYKEPTTEKEYTYYEINGGNIIAYRERKTLSYGYLLKTADKRNDLEQVYFDSETGKYYYAIEYTPNEEIFYYSKHDRRIMIL